MAAHARGATRLVAVEEPVAAALEALVVGRGAVVAVEHCLIGTLESLVRLSNRLRLLLLLPHVS
jgi:hypothetical protein